jgi:HK97 gp10 family phage protein
MITFTKNKDFHMLLQRAKSGGFATKKLDIAVSSTNIRSSIKTREYAQSIIRNKTEKSIAGLPFRNQSGLSKANIRSYATSKQITLIGGTDYFGFQEFGTKNMSAHPVLQPAFKAKASYIGRQLEETIIKHYLKY